MVLTAGAVTVIPLGHFPAVKPQKELYRVRYHAWSIQKPDLDEGRNMYRWEQGREQDDGRLHWLRVRIGVVSEIDRLTPENEIADVCMGLQVFRSQKKKIRCPRFSR